MALASQHEALRLQWPPWVTQSIALINPTSINPQNPASYTDVNRPAFNFDLKDEILTLSNNSSSSSSNSFAIQNFSFAFPIINDYKKFKRASGLEFLGSHLIQTWVTTFSRLTTFPTLAMLNIDFLVKAVLTPFTLEQVLIFWRIKSELMY